MESSFTTIEIILLIGAAQGLVLAIILFTLKRPNILPNRLLSAVLIIFSFNMAIHSVSHGKHFLNIPHHETVIFILFFLIGPLIYLYVKVLINSHTALNIKDFWHFLPFVILLLVSVPLYINSLVKNESIFFLQLIADTIIIHILIYTALCIKLLRSHSQKIKESYSSIDKINFNWLRFLILALGFLLIASFIEYLTLPKTKTWNYDWLIISILMYIIGYAGLRQPEIFSGKPEINLDEKTPKKKYEKSTLTEEMTEKYLQKLKLYIENEKPYLKNDLTLPELSEELLIPVHSLSQIINEQFNQNFFEFINSYRVEEAKKLIRQPDKQNINLASIAFESGFNSVSSFNSAFKKFAGVTPSHYRSNPNL